MLGFLGQWTKYKVFYVFSFQYSETNQNQRFTFFGPNDLKEYSITKIVKNQINQWRVIDYFCLTHWRLPQKRFPQALCPEATGARSAGEGSPLFALLNLLLLLLRSHYERTPICGLIT